MEKTLKIVVKDYKNKYDVANAKPGRGEYTANLFTKEKLKNNTVYN